jgi:hypothetical protein
MMNMAVPVIVPAAVVMAAQRSSRSRRHRAHSAANNRSHRAPDHCAADYACRCSDGLLRGGARAQGEATERSESKLLHDATPVLAMTHDERKNAAIVPKGGAIVPPKGLTIDWSGEPPRGGGQSLETS